MFTLILGKSWNITIAIIDTILEQLQKNMKKGLYEMNTLCQINSIVIMDPGCQEGTKGPHRSSTCEIPTI